MSRKVTNMNRLTLKMSRGSALLGKETFVSWARMRALRNLLHPTFACFGHRACLQTITVRGLWAPSSLNRSVFGPSITPPWPLQPLSIQVHHLHEAVQTPTNCRTQLGHPKSTDRDLGIPRLKTDGRQSASLPNSNGLQPKSDDLDFSLLIG